MVLGMPVHPAGDLLHPQRETVMLKQGVIDAYWLP
jgi:hypothetical protein